MVRFEVIQQQDSLRSVRGASGKLYDSLKGQPFQVFDDVDIEFFSKQTKRYKKLGLFENASGPGPSTQEILLKKLSEIPGVSKQTAEKLADMYGDVKHLEDAALVDAKAPLELNSLECQRVWYFFKNSGAILEEQQAPSLPVEEEEEEEEKEEVALDELSKGELIKMAKKLDPKVKIGWNVSKKELVDLVGELQASAKEDQAAPAEMEEDDDEE